MLETEASWLSKLEKDIAKEEGLVDEPRHAFELESKVVMLYYRRNPSMFGLHKFMVNEVIKKLEEKGIEYTLAKPGENKPDIMTKGFDIEVETRLKKDLNTLTQRVVNNDKETYVVIPNVTQEEKYREISNTKVMPLSEWNVE